MRGTQFFDRGMGRLQKLCGPVLETLDPCFWDQKQ